MTAAEILIKIRALFEKKPVEEAKKEVKNLGDEARKSGEDGAAGMHALGAATAAMNGNVGGAVSGIGKMVASVKGLKVSILSLSLATAAVTALVKLFQALRERVAQAAQAVRDIRFDNLKAGVESSRDAYERLEAAMRRAAAVAQADQDHRQAMRDAYREERMALLDLAEAKALSAAKDEEERGRVKLEFEGRRREAAGKFDAEAEADRAAGLRRRAEEADAAARRLEDLNRELEGALRSALKASGDAASIVEGNTTSKWRKFWNSRTVEAYGEEQRRHAEAAAGIQAQLAANRDRARDSRLEARRLWDEADAAEVSAHAAGIRREAGAVSHGTAVSDFERGVANRRAREAAEAEAERLERRYEELERRRDEAEFHGRARVDAEKREWQASQGALRDARRTGDQGAWNSASARERAEKADYERAAAELQGLVGDYKRQLQALSEQIRSVREAARRIPNS